MSKSQIDKGDRKEDAYSCGDRPTGEIDHLYIIGWIKVRLEEPRPSISTILYVKISSTAKLGVPHLQDVLY